MLSPQQAALEYAARGYRVLPIEPSTKRPLAALAPRGVHSATDNPHVLRAWFTAAPDANLAVVPPLGGAVLDFDEAGEFSRFLRRWPILEKAPDQERRVVDRTCIFVFLMVSSCVAVAVKGCRASRLR